MAHDVTIFWTLYGSVQYYWTSTQDEGKMIALNIGGGNVGRFEKSEKTLAICVSGTSNPPSAGESGSSSKVINGVTYTFLGPDSAKYGECVAFTLTRSTNAAAQQLFVPGFKLGKGLLYSNESCSTIAAFNTSIPAGGNSMKFYFKNGAPGGATTIDLTGYSDGLDYGERTINIVP